MYLRPSQIRFCQDSINNVFDKRSTHANRQLGETLDALLTGQCSISDIPTITVVDRSGVWYTVDNRRLWVFRKLEELGGCTEIRVQRGDWIPSGKLTTRNGGTSVTVRRDAGGYRWKSWNARRDADRANSVRRPTSVVTPRTNQQSTRFGVQSMPHQRQSHTTLRIQPSVRNVFHELDLCSNDSSNESTIYSRGGIQPTAGFIQSLVKLLDPANVRYTKDTIKAPPPGSLYRYKLTDPILVYRAFNEHWALDGNRRLWSYKEARQYDPSVKVPANVKDDEDEFLEKMRADRPWLTLLDIVQMGETVTVE